MIKEFFYSTNYLKAFLSIFFCEIQLDYQQRLEHMLERQKKNKIEYGSYIRALDNSLRVARRELDEVRLLVMQLERGKQQAAFELGRVQEEIEREREHREKDLFLRRQEAEDARKLEEWRKKKEATELEAMVGFFSLFQNSNDLC